MYHAGRIVKRFITTQHYACRYARKDGTTMNPRFFLSNRLYRIDITLPSETVGAAVGTKRQPNNNPSRVHDSVN
jgi:hypothetical protein